MNNTFCFKRFALYASKHYWENRLFYLLLIGIAFLAIVLIGTEFSFFPEIKHNNGYPMWGNGSRLYPAFFFVGIAFIIAVVSRSASGTKGDVFKMKDILLPVSFQERFWFIIFNSIVVATIVYLIVLYMACSYVELLYLFGDGVSVFKGLFPIVTVYLPKEIAVEALENRELFSFPELFQNNRLSAIESFGISVALLSAYLYCIAVMFWGSITFNRLKNFRIPITLLSHIVLIAGTIAGMVYIDQQVLGVPHYYYGLGVYHTHIFLNDGDLIGKMTPILLIPSFVYFFVAWKKLKTLEVYN